MHAFAVAFVIAAGIVALVDLVQKKFSSLLPVAVVVLAVGVLLVVGRA